MKAVHCARAWGALFLLMLPHTTAAQTWRFDLRDIDEDGRFNVTSVALEDDRAVLGAPSTFINGDRNGAVYVFERDGDAWGEAARLVGSNPWQSNTFGQSVALDGDRLAIGAPGVDAENQTRSQAYVYHWDGAAWTEVANLVPNDPMPFDGFSEVVALDGDWLVVGAPGDGPNDSRTGAVYVFGWDGGAWVETAKLTLPDAVPEDRFGFDVSISGARIVVAGFTEEVYIFEWNGETWEEASRLSFAGRGRRDPLDTAIDGDRIAVGGSFDEQDPGTVFVYEWDGEIWQQTARLKSQTGANDRFGAAVSIRGNRLAVSAPLDNNFHLSWGAAYVFEWDGLEWRQRKKLAAMEERLIYPVAIGNTGMLVGSLNTAFFFDEVLITPVEAEVPVPERVVLEGNYPNPFRSATTITYVLPQPEVVRLDVVDLLGRTVAVLVDGPRRAGRHQTRFDATALAAGVYFYRLQAGDALHTGALLLNR